MYIFIDPGETTGWAEFTNEGTLALSGQCKSFTTFVEWLMTHINPVTAEDIKYVIVEEFKLYPWKSNAQMWSQFETVQVIGAIRADCQKFGIPFELVPASNYSMGFRFMGQDVPPHSNPLHDMLVAQAHGVYWLQTHHIRSPQPR